MRLNDLITESSSEEIIEDVLFEEAELNEVYKGKRYLGSNLKADMDKFTAKAGTKGNPFSAMVTKYKNPVGTGGINQATSMVKGLPNATELLGLLSDYDNFYKEIGKLATDYDKWVSETKTKVSRITDDDAAAHKSMSKEVKTKLNSFYKQFNHYNKLMPKAYEKAKTFNPKTTASKNKGEIKERIKAGKEADKAAFKAKVDAKKAAVSDTFKGAGASFKNKVKGMAKSVNFNKDKA